MKSPRHRPRRGAVLVAVLVTMMVASLLFAAMLRTGREEHQMLRGQQLRLQAIELGQAGVERAAAQLAADAAYQSEVWRVSAAELGSRQDASVKIDVERVVDRPRRRRIQVEVNYPPAGEQRVQHRRQALVDLTGKDKSL